MEKCVLSGPERQLLMVSICGRLYASPFLRANDRACAHVHETEEKSPLERVPRRRQGGRTVIILEPLPIV